MKKFVLILLSIVMMLSVFQTASASKLEEDADHSTEAVNNCTDMADGTYVPASFAFSGGTGKVKITCPEITVADGKVYAHIVFSSSSYAYVKASGMICYAEIMDGKAHFTIPCELNGNNRILGLTTKMSTPHEVEYILYISMNETQSVDADSAPTLYNYELIADLTPAEAEYMRLYQYSDGIYLLEVETKQDTNENFTVSEKNLYSNPTLRYLIAPKETELPAGCENTYIILRTPIESICDGTGYSNRLDAAETTFCAENADEAEGTYAGSLESLNYKALIQNKVKLLVVNPSAQETVAEGIAERLNALNIPVLMDCSVLESSADTWDVIYKLLTCAEEG